jgi:hypothetical protein
VSTNGVMLVKPAPTIMLPVNPRLRDLGTKP